MNKHELQQSIVRRQRLDDGRTSHWLRSEGIDEETFAVVALNHTQAQRIAHNCLKHFGQYLGPNEAAFLNAFLKALSNRAKLKRITQAQIYKVMNIGSQVNRKAFRQHRQIKAN